MSSLCDLLAVQELARQIIPNLRALLLLLNTSKVLRGHLNEMIRRRGNTHNIFTRDQHAEYDMQNIYINGYIVTPKRSVMTTTVVLENFYGALCTPLGRNAVTAALIHKFWQVYTITPVINSVGVMSNFTEAELWIVFSSSVVETQIIIYGEIIGTVKCNEIKFTDGNTVRPTSDKKGIIWRSSFICSNLTAEEIVKRLPQLSGQICTATPAF